MLVYLIKRIGLAMVIIVISVSMLYGMIHMVPGDPISIILGPRATDEMREVLRDRMGLDKPFLVQIGRFLFNVVKGDLGEDVFTNRPVTQIVFEQLPYTIVLILTALAWALLVSIPLGCYSAILRTSILDKITGVVSVGTIAIPAFVVAVYTLLIFAVTLQWLPAIGAGREGDLWDQVIHLIMPAFCLGLSWVGYVARLVRASMLDVMQENHVRTVRAYGLPERLIIFRYALRVAIMPVIALVGVGVGYLLSAAVFIEIIFARPGIGRLIFDSVGTRNYPVVMGTVLIMTILFVISTTISDLVAAAVDPRLREKL
jgi:peptide/nickel transport system permease protein